jgi:hypothetical protein
VEAEQVLDGQVRAGQQCHREAQERQRIGGFRKVVAEHHPQQWLARDRVEQHHWHAEHGDQRKRPREHGAGVDSRPRSARGFRQ